MSEEVLGRKVDALVQIQRKHQSLRARFPSEKYAAAAAALEVVVADCDVRKDLEMDAPVLADVAELLRVCLRRRFVREGVR